MYRRTDESPQWPSPERKHIELKPDHVIKSMIDGAVDPDRLRRFIRAEIAAAEDNDRDVRRELIGYVNERLDEVEQ